MTERRRGFTLAEVLVVIVIICLMAGLLLPVLRTARAHSKQTVCTSQLRQLSVALFQYREDSDGELHSLGVGGLVALGYVQDSRLILCPQDAFGGLMSKHYECLGYRFRLPQSYYTPFSVREQFLWKALLKADENPGVIACRAHGTKRLTDSRDPCALIYYAYSGTVLRLRNDGSIVTRHCPGTVSGSDRPIWDLWAMMSDTPLPKFDSERVSQP